MPLSTSAITVPELPVVIFQAETASVAAASLVGVAVLGVSMYHCPLAVAVVNKQGDQFGMDVRIAPFIDIRKCHRRIWIAVTASAPQRRPRRRQSSGETRRVHARRELAAIATDGHPGGRRLKLRITSAAEV